MRHNDLDNLIEHAGEIKGKIGEYLREATDPLPLSRELATIRLDVELEFGLEDLTEREQDDDSLLELFKEYEFRSWIAELENAGSASDKKAAASEPEPTKAIEKQYSVITEQAELDKWLERLKAADQFAFDTETTSLRYMDAEIVGVSFAIEPGEAAYVPLGHDYMMY